MTKHFEFEKMEFKSINGNLTQIGTHRFSGVASFDGIDYTYNMFSQTFVRSEFFNGQIWLSDYLIPEESTHDLIEGHLQWLFNKPSNDDLYDSNDNKPKFVS
jgi:hypothetical protein